MYNIMQACCTNTYNITYKITSDLYSFPKKISSFGKFSHIVTLAKYFQKKIGANTGVFVSI